MVKTLMLHPEISENRLVENMDALCFSMIDASLDAAVSVLNEKLEYQYISRSVYEQLRITPRDLRVGDTLQKCHDLLVSNGLLTPDVIKRNQLSSPSQLERKGQTVFSSIMEFSDGRKIKLRRTKMDNGFTVSVSSDVSEHIDRGMLLEDALVLGQSGYWTLDLRTRETTLSKTLVHHCTHAVAAQVRKRGIIAIAVPDDRAELAKAIKDGLTGDGNFEVSFRTPNRRGEIRRCMTFGEILRDGFGRAVKIRAFVKDITDDYEKSQALEKAKDAAVNASKAKSQFLANMSHEIRTPMNGILGMAELLENTNVDKQQKEFIKVINNSSKALLTIINDILDFSKIEAGAMTLDPVPFDLNESVHDVGALMQRAAREKELELVINYAPDVPRYFIGDAGRVRQILNNLLSNAIKFTRRGHVKIDVAVTPVKNDLNIIKISVADTGIGIPQNKLDAIFGKFTQADGSTTRLYGGTGLGLSITKRIVELMNGRIKVVSEVGKGSKFVVVIPLPTDVNAQHVEYETTTLAKRRILVVDDIAVNRHVLSEQLKSWDVDPVVASSGAEALQILSEGKNALPFDMVLLDYLMPDIDGLSLAKTITEDANIAPVPLMMLTSFDPPMDSDSMAERGIMDCMTKPVREQGLYDRLVKHFTVEKSPVVCAENAHPIIIPEERAGQKKIDILVAEDFKLNQDVVRLMLADSAYNPVFAKDGEIAVEQYAANPDRYAVILMDISMPVKDGYQATQDILDFEAETGCAHTPIVALTGHALKHDREKCLEAGMDDYLSKPVKQQALLSTLRKYAALSVELKKTG